MLRSVFLLGLLVMAAVFFSGCESRSWPEALADLRAGAQAAEATQDQAARAALHAAIARRVFILLDGIEDLPPPLIRPEEIIAAPGRYCEATPPSPRYEQPPPAPPSPWQRFRSLGNTMITVGQWVFAIGAVLALVGWVAGKAGWAGILWQMIGSPLVAAVTRLAASLGGGSALLGAGIVWATTYWWALVLAGIAAGGLAWFTHRKDAAKLWARFTGQKSAPTRP
jgi:hypothetical protein